MPVLELTLTGAALSVRRFRVVERLSEPFVVEVLARSEDPSLDLAAMLARPARFRLESGVAHLGRADRSWSGVCRVAEQERVEPSGLSTYRFEIVPALWLLTHRSDHRIVRRLSAPEIASALLTRWGIEHAVTVDRAAYPRLDYKVQYGETDHAFFCRVLEEAGISHAFLDDVLTLADRLHASPPRNPALPFVDSPSEAAEQEMVTEVGLSGDVRPGHHVIRDVDPTRPSYAFFSEAEEGDRRLSELHYRPGASLVDLGEDGLTKHDDGHGRTRAARALAGERADRRQVSFRTSAVDLWPGRVFTLSHHPHPALAGDLLVTELSLEGAVGEEWTIRGRAVFTDVPYHPAPRAPRPRARVQSAVVVGPEPQEIHTDALGRVRVRFPWDREGDSDGSGSCWVRASQGWAGAGFGMMALPRVGQEVLIDFLGGDPEQPVVIGRVHNQRQPVVYGLPDRATRSGWKTASSPASGGWNEIALEDERGNELFDVRAEKDVRAWVKHDQILTVVGRRDHAVGADQRETTLGDRSQVTGGERVERTRGTSTRVTEGTRRDRVEGRAFRRMEMSELENVGEDQHLTVGGTKRERIENERHLTVEGSHVEAVSGTRSLSAPSIGESVGSYAVVARGPIHLIAGDSVVIEGAEVTVKGAGGFVKVDGAGVTLLGADVWINEGGSPGSGPGGGPKEPELPREAPYATLPARIHEDVESG